MKKYDYIDLTLDKDVYDKLNQKAKTLDMSIDDYCSKLIEEAMKHGILEEIIKKYKENNYDN